MITKIIFGLGMLVITLAIQFFLYKKGKCVSFWTGTQIVLIMCVLGLLAKDVDYLAGILGYVLGDDIGKFAGWHKYKKQENS